MKKIVMALLLVLPINVSALTLPDKIYQGDLVYGKKDKGEQVFMGDKQLPTMFDTFVFAVGRDAPKTLVLTVRKDGNVKTHPVTVLPYAWKIEHIRGVPHKTVEPSSLEQHRIAQEQIKINDARKETSLLGFPMCFLLPLEGRYSGLFGQNRVYNGIPKRPHGGIDIASPKGEKIKTVADGIVTLSEKDLFYTGGTIIIHHGSGLYSSYSHLSALNVSVGDKVKQGDVIGFVGATGRATGPHLHLTLMLGDVRFDPARVLKRTCP